MILLRLLIATLPLYSLLKVFGISICLILVGALCVVSVLRLVVEKRPRIRFTSLDFFLIGYVVSCFVASSYSQADTTTIALIKTLTYVAAFYLISELIGFFPRERVLRTLGQGAVIGLVLIVAATLYSYFSQGLNHVDFDYWRVTMKVFSQLAIEYFGYEEFGSPDLQRNSLAEAFVLYGIVFLSIINHKTLRFGGLAASLAMVVFLQSRRALFAFVVSIAFHLVRHCRTRFQYTLLTIVLLVSVIAAASIVEVSASRLTSLDLGARSVQYIEAIVNTYHNGPWGEGFASKIDEDMYVHNLPLSGLYMNGVVGGTFATLILLWLAIRYVKAIGSREIAAAFLIIPITGALVGSTVEGIFTLNAWLALAIYRAFGPGLRVDNMVPDQRLLRQSTVGT